MAWFAVLIYFVGDEPYRFSATRKSRSHYNGHDKIAELLVLHGAKVDSVDTDGNTPLIAAARTGHVELVQVLLPHGTWIDLANAKRKTPVLAAGSSGEVEVVRALIKKGASVHVQDSRGETTPIAAARWNHVETVRLLLECGLFTNVTASGTSLLSATLETLVSCRGEMQEMATMWVRLVDRLEEINTQFLQREKIPEPTILQYVIVISDWSFSD
ncbi:Tkl protein kinase, partial [Globisporangium splendens]